MAPNTRFRTSFNGFNREDVVNYIEYLNNQHKSQLDQLSNQLQAAQSARVNQQAPSDTAEQLRQQLLEAQEKCAQLEQALARQPVQASPVNDELEAYRRAERTERMAQERAQQIYAQANAALAEAARQAEVAAAHIGTVADQAASQLKECQDSVAATKTSFQDAVAALYAIRPEEPQEEG